VSEETRPCKHEIKTWPTPFQASWVGDKPWELRLNDRNYKERDEVVLQEFDPDTGEYSGREIEGVIRLILKDPLFGVLEGYCIFTIQETYRRE